MHRQALIVFSILAAVFALRNIIGDSVSEELVHVAASRGAFDNSLVPKLREIIPRFVVGTRFENRWTINEAPARDSLNVYIIDSSKAKSLLPPQIINSCTYLGPPQIILCDTPFIFELSSSLARENRNEDETSHVEDFLTWAIGHEIGHVISGHLPAHFSTNSFASSYKAGNESFKIELEADEFVTDKLKNDQTARKRISFLLLAVTRTYVVKHQGCGFIRARHSAYNIDHYYKQDRFSSRLHRSLSCDA